MDLRFTVEGPPIPYQRVGRRGGGRAFKPKRMVEHMERIAEEASVALRDSRHLWSFADWPTDARYRLEVTAYLPTRRRVDADNLGKIIMDALNGVIWADDAQVSRLEVEKRHDMAAPRTVVLVEVLP